MFKPLFKLFLNRPILLSILFTLSTVAWSLEDPTRPSSYRSVGKKQEGLRLESILFSETRKVAVINGNVLSEGDAMGGTKVIRISKNSVMVSDNGKSVTLELSRTDIRQEK
ncbi:hypothetical protein [Oceanicoccus sagamiensis]|uniref:hypothetical protein n=1 Tax=Oceanicoccus sagamiensis TaxID=716816 RepID=UPI000A268508|nr:hypothetical protein [Oceanicoccus sagamiensis]